MKYDFLQILTRRRNSVEAWVSSEAITSVELFENWKMLNNEHYTFSDDFNSQVLAILSANQPVAETPPEPLQNALVALPETEEPAEADTTTEVSEDVSRAPTGKRKKT